MILHNIYIKNSTRSKFENKVSLKAKSTKKTKEGEEGADGAAGAAESDTKSVPSVPEETLLEGII